MTDTRWLSDMELACRRRGVTTWVEHPDTWVLSEQITLGLRKADKVRYVIYTEGCDIQATTKEINAALDELDPNGRT